MYQCDECGCDFDEEEADMGGNVEGGESICAFCNSEEAADGRYED